MSTITIDADKVNWELLRKQKQLLGGGYNEELEALVVLLDLLQKKAAPVIGEKAVYGARQVHLSGDVTGVSDRFQRGTVYKYRLYLLDAGTCDMVDTYEDPGTFLTFEAAAKEMVRVAEVARTEIIARGRWTLFSFTLGKLVELI